MTTPRELVRDPDRAITLQTCELYAHHCAVINNHHICPASWFERAGKTVETPMIELCPNCHANVHAAIDSLIAGTDTRNLPPRCVKLARWALDLAEEAGLTPRPTL